MIELEAARAALARQLTRREDEQLVDFARRQIHGHVMPAIAAKVKARHAYAFVSRCARSYHKVGMAGARRREEGPRPTSRRPSILRICGHDGWVRHKCGGASRAACESGGQHPGKMRVN